MKYFGIREIIPCVDGQCRDQRCGYDENTIVKVPPEVVKNAIALVEEVLDPARERLGKPIKVNSGYRCPLKNKAVGGVEKSQHLLGEAADITPCTLIAGLIRNPHPEKEIPHQVRNEELAALARIIVENGKFDQMILYPTFIHVSWKRNGTNRHKILRKTSTGYTPVSPDQLLTFNSQLLTQRKEVVL